MEGESWNMEDLKGLETSNFLPKSLSVMQYQAMNNAVYREWIQSMKVDLDRVKSFEQIPFLPIDFFKSHTVYTGSECPSFYFESSGTTGSNTSRHYVKDAGIYQQSCPPVMPCEATS